MKNLIILILAVTLGVGLYSCKKKGCTNELATNYNSDAQKDDNSCEFGDTTKPVITIKEPTESMYQLMNGEANIPISVEISDDGELHSVELTLMNVTDSEEVLHLHLHPDEATTSIDTSYIATEAHKDYELKIIAEDHDENASEETKSTHVHMM